MLPILVGGGKLCDLAPMSLAEGPLTQKELNFN